jgi:hypothetical protein
MKWEGYGRKWSWHILRYSFSICTYELREMIKEFATVLRIEHRIFQI